MDGLRWLLLLFGLLVIAGVYFYSRREKTIPEAEPLSSERVEPTLGADDSPGVSELDNEAEDASLADADADRDAPLSAEKVPQKIVTLRLVARDGGGTG